jgi:hypothetical protein
MATVFLAVVAAVVLCVVVAVGVGRRRTARLREEFGPEYERTLQAHGDQYTAEAELRRRLHEHDALDIRPLDPAAREAYLRRWEDVQSSFADEPERGVEEADALVADILRERGYPEDFERHAAVISVDHPDTVEHLRAAHAICLAKAANGARTENLRQAMDHFRALVEDLLDTRG